MTQIAECAHHWKIGFEEGVDSPARCKLCGAERRFANGHFDKSWKAAVCKKCGLSRSTFGHMKECGTG